MGRPDTACIISWQASPLMAVLDGSCYQPSPPSLGRPPRSHLQEARQDPYFLTDAMDTLSRHEVNRLTHVRCHTSPHATDLIADLTTAQVCDAIDLLGRGLAGPAPSYHGSRRAYGCRLPL